MIQSIVKKTTQFVAEGFPVTFGLVAFISLAGGSLLWFAVLSAGGGMGTILALLVVIPLHILLNILLFGLIAMYIQNNEYLRQIRDALERNSCSSASQSLSDEGEFHTNPGIEGSGQQRIHNFQEVIALLANRGFNCTKSSDRANGTSFTAHHVERGETLSVQLKTRLHIDKKLSNRSLFIAFPVHGDWYLIEHDKLVDLVGENATYLKTQSWEVDGIYHTTNPNKYLLSAIAEYRLSP